MTFFTPFECPFSPNFRPVHTQHPCNHAAFDLGGLALHLLVFVLLVCHVCREDDLLRRCRICDLLVENLVQIGERVDVATPTRVQVKHNVAFRIALAKLRADL